MKSLFTFRLVSLMVCSALVAACGGGGGGGSNPAPQPTPPTTFTLGGTLTGLATGASVVLQFNGGSSTTVSANGSYSFAAAIPSGTAYTVTVSTQPSGQSCTVANGSGTVSANVTNVAVTCASTAPATVTIGGTLTGLAPSASVVLQNNGGSNLTVSADGNFTFGTAINSGAAYAVTVLTQPTAQTCVVANDNGTASANVTNVAVTCTNNPPQTFTLGGTVSGLAASTSVVLQWNGGSDLTVSANGNFTFTNPINSGTAYTVTVLTQPTAQTCTVTGGATGTLSANVTNVTVNCVANPQAVAGTVSGLIGSIVLRNNGASDLAISADGPFSFGTQNPGTAYLVTIFSKATTVPQNCNVTNGSGTIGSTATNISVVCVSVDQTPPTVTARAPMPTAVGSKVRGGVVFVEFSEAIDTTSINTSSFTVQGPSGAVSGEITFATNNTQAIFTPGSVAVPAALAYDTSYTVTLTTAVRDPSHNTLASNDVWTFNTGKKLAIGFEHACARLDDGGVKCWGSNGYGQLGYDDAVSRGDTFTPMSTVTRVNLGTNRTAVALAAGDYSTCARLDDGTTKCWGSNEFGQLGQSTDGNNQSLGDQPNEMENLPAIDFGGGRSALEIAAGEAFACARLDDDTVKCWGLNTSGQLGQDNTIPLGINAGDLAAAPAIVLGTGLKPRGLALGHYHACALLQDSTGGNHVRCWGDNRWGQLGIGHGGPGTNIGDGAPFGMDTASDVNFGTGRTATLVAANGGHTCALLDNASVKCWGLNTWGQVGLNVTNHAVDPVACTSANDCIGDAANEMGDALSPAIGGGVARLTVGARHNCVLLTGGELKCWGSNQEGQLGLGDKSGSKEIIGDEAGEMPALAATALKAPVVEEATAGGFETCVWNTDDTLNCWGWNSRGQLGHNSNDGPEPDDSADWGDGPNEMGAFLTDTVLGN